MIRPGDPDAGAGEKARPSVLMVTTIAHTLKFVLPYAAHFRQAGWRVEAAASGATVDPALEGLFDRLHELSLSRSILDVRGILHSLRDFSGVLESGFDIVHVHTPIAAFVTRAAIRRLPAERRPAAVYTAHGFHFHPQGGFATNVAFLAAEKIAGRWTDRLVVINRWDHAAATRNRIVPREHLLLMPGIGVDTGWYARSSVPAEEIERSRAGLGIGPATPLFAVVGRLESRKRPVDVVAALGQMRHRDCHLVLLGDGPERSRVRAMAQQSRVMDRVHVVGSVTDIRPTVAASTAMVLASSREGLPRSTMEALSLGVPVVTTDARGNPDLVVPDAGLVVPIGDVPALAAAMDRILDDPGEARAMGERGRARMVEHYDVGILIAKHEALYRDVLAERSARRR